MKPNEWAKAGVVIARTFGARGLAHRIWFEARKQLRSLKHYPSEVDARVREAPVAPSSPFRPHVARLRAASDRASALSRAERVSAGEYQRYRWTWVKRPRTSDEWIRHPESGRSYPPRIPWYRIAHIDARMGDIKDVWDPARFGWAFDLARGWMVTANEAYAVSFNGALEDFLDACPPFRGVHWSCGQETAIRAIAWLWCEAAFDEAASFTQRGRQRLREALAWSAERIEDGFDYALSQRNNHGLSEATGLVAIGVRFADVEPRAARWIARGAAHLDDLVRDQFSGDGWYAQHSFAYTRLALDQLVIARRSLRHAERDLSAESLQRIASAIRLLITCTDSESGDVPNHGANDGSFVLPITTRPYRDFRASLTAAAVTFGVPLPNSMAADLEVLAWLHENPPAQQTAASLPRVSSGASGWAVAETSGARVFARAGHYQTRPGHLDPGHVDIWVQGAKQAVDAGTFRYVAPDPWRNGLVHVEVHNTVSIDGLPVAVRGPRFLWLSWPDARVVSAERGDNDDARIVIENYSWRRAGVIHRRTCQVRASSVVVIDELETPTAFDRVVRVHWLLEDGATVAMSSEGEATLIQQRGVERATFGWISEGYGDRRAVRSVRLEARPQRGHLRIVSAFGDAAPVEESTNRQARMITCAS